MTKNTIHTSKTNTQFWNYLLTGDTHNFRKTFEAHRNYLIKINGIPKILWHFIFLGMDDLSLSLLKKPEQLYKGMNTEDKREYNLCEAYFYAFQSCFHKSKELLDSKIEGLTEEERVLHGGCLYAISGQESNAFHAFTSVSINTLKTLSPPLFIFYCVALILNDQEEIAHNTLSSINFSNAPDYQKRYLNYCQELIKYKTQRQTLDYIFIELQNILTPQIPSLLNHYIFKTLGKMAQTNQHNEKAKDYALLSLQNIPPSYKTLYKNTYQTLHNLKQNLSLEEQLHCLCDWDNPSEAKDLVWINKRDRFYSEKYNPTTISGNHVDLMAGKLFLHEESIWLTQQQTRVLLLIIISGSPGIHISSILHRLSDKNTTEKSIEGILAKLKQYGLSLVRINNVIRIELSPSVLYIIPQNFQSRGVLAQLVFKEHFKRVDIEKLICIKKTVAAEMIKGWLTEELIIKRPDISPYAYSLKTLPARDTGN